MASPSTPLPSLPWPPSPPWPPSRGGASPAARSPSRQMLLVGSLATMLVLGLLLRPSIGVGLAVIAAIVIPLERLRPVRRQRVLRAQWLSDLVHVIWSSTLATVGVVAVAVVLAVVVRSLVGTTLSATFGAWPSWIQIAIAVVISDVVAYWAHRATHRFGWLWRFHAVHHSVTEMDWLAAARLHPLDAVWGRSWGVAALVGLGVTRETFGGWLVVLTFLAVFQHANVRLDLGPLRWFVANPQVHHWHHADQPEAMNKNFSSGLPLLDVVFGTAWCPRHEWPTAMGTSTPVPDHWWGQLVAPFRRRGRPTTSLPSGP